MIKSRRLATILLFVVAGIVSATDIYFAINGIPDDTYSQLILSGAHDHPMIPFAFGIICGHLFWPQTERK